MGGNGKEKEGVEGEGKEEKRGRRGEGVHVHVALYPMWSGYEARGGGGGERMSQTFLIHSFVLEFHRFFLCLTEGYMSQMGHIFFQLATYFALSSHVLYL